MSGNDGDDLYLDDFGNWHHKGGGYASWIEVHEAGWRAKRRPLKPNEEPRPGDVVHFNPTTRQVIRHTRLEWEKVT